MGFLECFLGSFEFFICSYNGWIVLESIGRATASTDSRLWLLLLQFLHLLWIRSWLRLPAILAIRFIILLRLRLWWRFFLHDGLRRWHSLDHLLLIIFLLFIFTLFKLRIQVFSPSAMTSGIWVDSTELWLAAESHPLLLFLLLLGLPLSFLDQVFVVLQFFFSFHGLFLFLALLLFSSLLGGFASGEGVGTDD